jgi:hypothetical protein
MWEQGSVQGLSSQPHKSGMKNVFEYFSFDKVKILLVNINANK